MALGGVTGKVVFCNLKSGEITIETPDEQLYKDYLGGYGLGAYYLYTRTEPIKDPLGQEALFGIVSGPLSGTPAICGNRFQIVGKSPKTGGFGDANCGGTFGPAIKWAGFDAAFFTGIAEKPVYLLLRDGKAELKSAEHLWGLDVGDLEDKLKEEYGKNAQVVSIGPAGEKISLMAAVMNDRDRAAARSGLGAVMGSKRLKAVVAVSDKKSVPLADEEKIKGDRKKHLESVREHGLYKVLHEYGTCGITDGCAQIGDAPLKNWKGAFMDMNVPAISDDSVVKYQVKRYGCWNCPIACGGFVKVPEGKFAVEGGKPEYETVGAFGTMTLVEDIEAICKANDICNRMGIDTISVGATIAFAMECYEKGVITKDDTDGLDLTWGNAEAVVALTEKIARREGFGDVLADGMARAIERIGRDAEQYAMHVGGEELPMHDPRCSPGLTWTYKWDATPGRHTQFSAWCAEGDYIPSGLEDRFDGWTPDKKYEYTGKAKASLVLSSLMHVVNAAGICQFGFVCTPAQGQVDFLNAAMGVDWTMDDVLKIGERIGNLRMAFNAREGVKNKYFKLPGRVYGNPPMKKGPTKGITVNVEIQEKEHLEEMGWTEEGVPKKETLERLGLDFAAKDLYPEK